MLLHYCRLSSALYVPATTHCGTIYSAICIPKLLYGVEVWTPSQAQTMKLEGALSQAGRLIQGLSQCASSQVSYQLLGWDCIETMISMAKLLHVFRVLTATTYHTWQCVLLHSLNNCRFGLQTRGPAADIYKCAITVGAQTLLLSLLDSGQPITYHRWKNNIVCLVKKKQYTLHSIFIQMNASYEWFRQVVVHKDFKAGNMPWLAITKLYPAYTKKCHSLNYCAQITI